MMKPNNTRVLFVCNLFAPANHISAIRPTKIAKYLKWNFHVELDVIASNQSLLCLEDSILKEDIERSKINVKYLEESKIAKTIRTYIKSRSIKTTSNNCKDDFDKKAKNNRRVGLLQKFKKFALYFLYRVIDKENKKTFISYFKKIIKNKKFNYDCIVSFGPNYTDLTCKYLKKMLKEDIKWIADFRDPVLNINTPLFFRERAKKYCNLNIKRADRIVAVSPGYLKSLFPPKKVASCVITNGFDKADLDQIQSDSNSNACLRFCCVGALYEGKRKINALVDCLSDLIGKGIISATDFYIDYAGPSSETFVKVSLSTFFSNRFIDHGIISRNESLKLQYSSDVLVLPTWSDYSGEDIIPGKFFEYMLFGKPILSLTSGITNEDYVSKTIEDLKIGFAYLESKGETEMLRLEDFLLVLFANWKMKKNNAIDEQYYEKIEKFDYRNIAKNYYDIIIN